MNKIATFVAIIGTLSSPLPPSPLPPKGPYDTPENGPGSSSTIAAVHLAPLARCPLPTSIIVTIGALNDYQVLFWRFLSIIIVKYTPKSYSNYSGPYSTWLEIRKLGFTEATTRIQCFSELLHCFTGLLHVENLGRQRLQLPLAQSKIKPSSSVWLLLRSLLYPGRCISVSCSWRSGFQG